MVCEEKTRVILGKLEKFHHQIVAGSEEQYFAVFDKVLQVTRLQVEICG